MKSEIMTITFWILKCRVYFLYISTFHFCIFDFCIIPFLDYTISYFLHFCIFRLFDLSISELFNFFIFVLSLLSFLLRYWFNHPNSNINLQTFLGYHFYIYIFLFIFGQMKFLRPDHQGIYPSEWTNKGCIKVAILRLNEHFLFWVIWFVTLWFGPTPLSLIKKP